MFTVDQINKRHESVQSGADFPAYIRDIKAMGITGFVTWVADSHTDYIGNNGYSVSSGAQYADLTISDSTDAKKFKVQLKMHQQGKSDYGQFCHDCAATGIEKWIVDLIAMTCTYYNKAGEEILVEQIPG